MEPRGLKRQRLDSYDNEEDEGLDKFEGESEKEGIGYILLLFVALLQKESNHLTDMGKGIRSLNHLIYIPKIG